MIHKPFQGQDFEAWDNGGAILIPPHQKEDIAQCVLSFGTQERQCSSPGWGLD